MTAEITRDPGSIRAVLFDLDGTFADTAPDMARALNVLRFQRGLPELPLAIIRPHVSRGARGMLDVGFGINLQHESFAKLRDAFYDEYQQNVCIESALFDGEYKTAEATGVNRLSETLIGTTAISASTALSML